MIFIYSSFRQQLISDKIVQNITQVLGVISDYIYWLVKMLCPLIYSPFTERNDSFGLHVVFPVYIK